MFTVSARIAPEESVGMVSSVGRVGAATENSGTTRGVGSGSVWQLLSVKTINNIVGNTNDFFIV